MCSSDLRIQRLPGQQKSAQGKEKIDTGLTHAGEVQRWQQVDLLEAHVTQEDQQNCQAA